jgi:hypothetical protein
LKSPKARPAKFDHRPSLNAGVTSKYWTLWANHRFMQKSAIFQLHNNRPGIEFPIFMDADQKGAKMFPFAGWLRKTSDHERGRLINFDFDPGAGPFNSDIEKAKGICPSARF